MNWRHKRIRLPVENKVQCVTHLVWKKFWTEAEDSPEPVSRKKALVLQLPRPKSMAWFRQNMLKLIRYKNKQAIWSFVVLKFSGKILKCIKNWSLCLKQSNEYFDLVSCFCTRDIDLHAPAICPTTDIFSRHFHYDFCKRRSCSSVFNKFNWLFTLEWTQFETKNVHFFFDLGIYALFGQPASSDFKL